MAELRWIKMSLILMLVLQFTAAVTGDYSPHIVVRDGAEVTLLCENVMDDQDNCRRTSWLFVDSRNAVLQELVVRGQLGKDAEAKSNRLSVTENCSVVIKKVTVDDAGHYTCRQFKSEEEQNSHVHLFVATMTDRKDPDRMTLYCSVSIHQQYCGYTVKWLYEDKDVDEDEDMTTSQSHCSAAVTFPPSDLRQKSKFKCEVTDVYTDKVQQFDFSPQPSGNKPDETTLTTENWDQTRTTLTGPENNSSPTPTESSFDLKGWLLYIAVASGFLVLILIIVTIIIWRKTKNRKTQKNKNTELTLNPAVTESGPETAQDTADPEDGVCYASISYAKKTHGKAQVQAKNDDDEGETVTYSTLKPSSSAAAAGAPDDLCTLYASINKPKK